MSNRSYLRGSRPAQTSGTVGTRRPQRRIVSPGQSMDSGHSRGGGSPSTNNGKGGLIAGMLILGLIAGGGIAAGTIHAIKPLDGESGNTVSADTYIKKTELTNNGLYKTTGSGNSLVISKDVSDNYIEKSTVDSDYTLNTEIPKTHIPKTDITENGIYRSTGLGDTRTVEEVSNLYSLKTQSILKTRFTDGGLYEATGTGDALDVGSNVRNSYTLTSDITKTYIPKTDIGETGIYRSTGSGDTRTVEEVTNLYNLKTGSILKGDLTDGHLYKATGTGDALDLGNDVTSLYTLKTDIPTTHIPKTDFAHEHLYKATEGTIGDKNTITTDDVTETYIKKPTNEDKTFTFKFDTASEITLNLPRATSSTRVSDAQATIDPISSPNTSLSDDPAVAKDLSEIKISVGETKTLYLTSNQQTAKTSPFITSRFFVGVKFTITLLDEDGNYRVSRPTATANSRTTDVIKIRRTTGTGNFNLIWNSIPRTTETQRLQDGAQVALLDPLVLSAIRNSIPIDGTNYYTETTVNNNLKDLYSIAKEDVNIKEALITLGQGTNSIVKGNYKLYGSEGHSIDSLELTRIASGATKKFYLVAPLLQAPTATLASSGPGDVLILTLSITKTGEVLTGEIEGDIRKRSVADITTYGDFSSKSTGWNVVDQNDPAETLRLTTAQRTLTREFLDYLFVQNSIT